MSLIRKIATLCIPGLIGAFVATSAWAGEYHLKNLTIHDAWARASAGMARAGAAFMSIENAGKIEDTLLFAEAKVSDVTELHTHIHDQGVMRMRKVDAIAVPAGQETWLKPGGLHVMFIGLHQPLVKGQTFDLLLHFKNAGKITVPVVVEGVGAKKFNAHKGHDMPNSHSSSHKMHN